MNSAQQFIGRHWSLTQEPDGIAWLVLDNADGGGNVLSGAIIQELDLALAAIEQLAPIGVIIRSAKANGFIAGADVKEFTTFQNFEAALLAMRRVKPIFDRLEALACPTVALIHGFCLGGGLELALACRYRVAENEPETRLGLPEVKLGIHPGFGGTVRLPQRIGDLQALAMMLTGRTLNASAALKLGLVDRIAPKRQIERAARDIITQRPPERRASFWQRLPSLFLLRNLTAAILKRKTEAHAPEIHYPAPYALLNIWSHHARNPKLMYEAEMVSVANLITGITAGNLIRLFMLRDMLKVYGKRGFGQIKQVHVIGAGVMGGDIASWCAFNGLTVTLQDSRVEGVSRAMVRAARLFSKLLHNPLLERNALDRLIPDPEGHGIPKADVVIEAVFENLEVKRRLFQEVEPRLKPGALLATNTSSIPLEEIASVLANPERFLGLHFFNPVSKMPLLEVVRGRQTNEEAMVTGYAFANAINRLPLPVVSSPGFLINRILMPYMLEAVTLVSEGVNPQAVDKVAQGFGMPMGPITLADTVGLDICKSVAAILTERMQQPVPSLLLELVGIGALGRKSGRGFYRYDKEKVVGVEVKGNKPADADAEDRLFLALINEAVACLREGVVANPDLLDAGVVFGTGFAPFRGGPGRYIGQRGRQAVVQRLRELSIQYGPRFKPDPGWEEPALIAALDKVQ